MGTHIHVLYAADENYVRHAAASMVSLMEHNIGVNEITIHFLSMGVSEKSMEQLSALCAERKRHFAGYELGDIRRWFDFPVNARGFAPSTLARLFIARVLPEDVSRVLYLDCDTIVTDDLTALWHTDMGTCYLGMVAEPTATKARRVQLGMDVNQPYFNAGVLLINLALWRSEDAEGTVLRYYCSKGGDFIAPDQDAINGAFPGRIYELAPRYNYGSVQIYYPWKAQKRISAPTPFMNEEAYRKGKEKPAIIHYLGEERPWRAGNHHPYTVEYERNLALTPWKDSEKDEGWRMYFLCFGLFNTFMKPFPYLRWRIIDGLIPVFMKHRERQLKKRQ